MNWTPATTLPVKPGEYSAERRFIVQVQEFGCQPVFYIARCFVSALHPNSATWTTDEEFYGDGHFYTISGVQWYMPFPDPAPCIGVVQQLTLLEGK